MRRPVRPSLHAAALAACLVTACAAVPPAAGDGAASAGSAGTSSAPVEPVAAPAPEPVNPVAGLPRTQWPANYETLHIKVSGMTCPLKCVREVKEMLQRVPGVLFVAVDYDEREVSVDVTPGTDPQSVLRGLTGGYSGRLL